MTGHDSQSLMHSKPSAGDVPADAPDAGFEKNISSKNISLAEKNDQFEVLTDVRLLGGFIL